MSNAIAILKERGLLEALTDDELETRLSPGMPVYAGFDPSSDSLQVGNLVAIMGLAHFQRAGHRVIALLGGATGRIGDPSGKSAERDLISLEQLGKNTERVQENLSRFLEFSTSDTGAALLNNYDWMNTFSAVDFLRDVGKHFRMGSMLGKDSVRSRLDSDGGMSYAEFSYQILQAYDFLHLFKEHDCVLQLGGSDQWGNITAGIDLIHKTLGAEAHGITMPLICDHAGDKFGKSEGNAIYLNTDRTSVYDFYQFFLRTDDADAIRFLKIFTFMSLAEISTYEETVQKEPEKRTAQTRLAEEVTRMVHGADGLAIAQRASDVLFGGSIEDLSAADLLQIFADVPSTELSRADVLDRSAADVATAAGATKSKSEARRLISGGGLYVNNNRVDTEQQLVTAHDLTDDRVLMLRTGKKKFHLVQVI